VECGAWSLGVWGRGVQKKKKKRSGCGVVKSGGTQRYFGAIRCGGSQTSVLKESVKEYPGEKSQWGAQSRVSYQAQSKRMPGLTIRKLEKDPNQNWVKPEKKRVGNHHNRTKKGTTKNSGLPRVSKKDKNGSRPNQYGKELAKRVCKGTELTGNKKK